MKVRTRIRIGETAVAGAVWCIGMAVITLSLAFLYNVTVQHLPSLPLRFVLDSPVDAGRAGGIASILASTAILLIVCLSVAVPFGLGAALLLSEFSSSESRFARGVHGSLYLLASTPSIVFGLFGNAFFCGVLQLRLSLLSGGLTLACMVLPFFAEAACRGFRSFPTSQRLAAASLGLGRSSTFFRLVLPASAPSLFAGLTLSIGRALAETAALIFTSGYVDRMPSSLFDSGRSLSIHIYDLSMNVAGGDMNARRSVTVLVLLLLAIHMLTRFLLRGTQNESADSKRHRCLLRGTPRW